MASYWVIGSYKTIKVLSQNTVLDAEQVNAQTVPHGLGFSYAVPIESWRSGAGGGLLEVIAAQLEEMATGNHVVASTPVQDEDNNGLLVDTVEITVAYDRSNRGLPPLTGTVNVPIQSFFDAETGIGGFTVPGTVSPASVVSAEYQRLTQLPPG